MKHFCTTAVVALFVACASHAEAQNDQDGADLLEQGIQQLFRELFSQLDPVLKDFQSLNSDIGPKIRQFIELVDDFSNYESPEKLPNGDILMRRIRPLKEGEIEL